MTHQSGPLLIVAGAGTGKTRVLVHRLANLIQVGNLSPESILAVTFSNRGAQELRSRVSALVGDERAGLSVGTFHWLGHRLLRRYGSATPFGSRFTLLTPAQSLSLLKQEVRSWHVGAEGASPYEIRDAISSLRSGVAPVSIAGIEIEAIAAQYESALRQRKSIDLDGLITESVRLLESREDIRLRLQRHFAHILADEYQDTSPPQSRLLQLLTSPNGNITVVGDDDQAIYGWRQASNHNMLDFAARFSGAVTTVRLEENYRSSQRILRPANELMQRNESRIPKTLFSTRLVGPKPTIFGAGDESEEALFVASRIAFLLGDGLDPAKIAVLYRVNAQSRLIEDGLIRAGVPYEIRAGKRFYERPEVSRIIDVLRVAGNRKDALALSALLQRVHGLGPARVAALLRNAGDDPIEWLSGMSAPPPGTSTPMVQMLASGVRKISSIGHLETQVAESAGLVNRVLGPVGVSSIDREAAEANVAEFVSVATQFDSHDGVSLREFLDRLAISEPAGETGGVQLMTLHSAKGLEFDAVFVAGIEEGLLPHARSLDRVDEIEEERRLLYVGMTRARTWLYLSYARSRFLAGHHSLSQPSRFLDEMPRNLFDVRYGIENKPRDRLVHVAIGDLVEHPRWGTGRVVAVQGGGRSTMITIEFSTGIRQTVQLRHTPLKRIS